MSAHALKTANNPQPFSLADWWSRNQRKVIPYIFLAPFLLSFAIFTVYPGRRLPILELPAHARLSTGGRRRRGRARIQGLGELRAPADQGQALSRSHDQWRRILAGHLAGADAAGAGGGAGAKFAKHALPNIGAISLLCALYHLGRRRRLDIQIRLRPEFRLDEFGLGAVGHRRSCLASRRESRDAVADHPRLVDMGRL